MLGNSLDWHAMVNSADRETDHDTIFLNNTVTEYRERWTLPLFSILQEKNLSDDLTGECTYRFKIENKLDFSQSGSLTLPGSDNTELRHCREEREGGSLSCKQCAWL